MKGHSGEILLRSAKDMELDGDGTQQILTTGGGRGSGSVITRLVVVLIVLSLLVSTIAIILSATSLSREGTTINVASSRGGSSGSGKLNDDVWLFAIGHDGSRLEYIDDTTGTLRGFHVDIVNAVCAQANKNCRLVWDVYENCWKSEAGQQSRAGQGIMGGWYDGCTGWFNTYERSIALQYTSVFRKQFESTFWVRQGNPRGFNPATIGSGQRIGFGDGWSTDEHCLLRNADVISGVPLDPSQIVHYSSGTEMSAALRNNEVIAVFANSHVFLDTDLQTIGPTITNCQRDGAGIMSRMDSALNAWWNPAFEAVRQSGVYRDICGKLDTEHAAQFGFGGEVICID